MGYDVRSIVTPEDCAHFSVTMTTPALVLFCVVAWLLAPALSAAGQHPAPQSGAPVAQWCAAPGADPQGFGVYHYRQVLRLASKPDRYVVHLSADNRYRLLVNGRLVAEGPQRSDLGHWRYETVDLAPHLQAGDNILAALVWNWGPYAPLAQHTNRSGFICQPDSAAESAVATPGAWRVLRNTGYEPVPVRAEEIGGYYASAPGEAVKGAAYPWGWDEVQFDDASWAVPVGVGAWSLQGQVPYGDAGGWQLTPRTLPPMETGLLSFASVRRVEGMEAVANRPFTVPPKTRAVVLLDQGQLANAHPVLQLSGGREARLTLTYAEALVDAAGRKGHRDDVEGRRIVGVRDVFVADGGDNRRYQTLWFRTYRYVQLEIETAEQALRVDAVHGLSTGFPFVEKARFACDQAWIADMWRINWRVARLCAWETYFDTPYYEQLQYLGDARLQALLSYSVAGDDRLAREAIIQFDNSRDSSGLTASRHPSRARQVIPPFSLIWVLMVHDHWMYRGDAAFIRERLPGIRAVLDCYAQRVDDTGMVGRMPWWNFVDWAEAWPAGVPPTDEAGRSTPISLLFAEALRRGAELEAALGRESTSPQLRALADKVCEGVRRAAWDSSRGLFSDAPGGTLFSQQTNALAILADAVPPAGRANVMEKVLADSSLVPASYYFGYYVREAMLKAGLGDRYIEQLAPWRQMLALGLTTTPETAEPTRSDSHAWSAHPNHGLLATVLGVRPSAPGFARVVVAPHLGALTHAEGVLPHPKGEIVVKLVRKGEGLEVEVTLPSGVEGDFEWQGNRQALQPGVQRLQL